MIKNKKTISFVLSVSLLTNPLILMADTVVNPAVKSAADSFSKGFMSNFDNMSNVTKGEVFNDDGKTTYFGGGIELRFNNNMSSFEPWIELEEPKMKAGCNGISLDAGFGQFLEIGKIVEQLGKASGAMLWGIIVGLINSMPTLEHTFSKIKEWMDKLMSMLRNACNTSAQLTQMGMNALHVPKVMQAVVDAPVDYIDAGAEVVKNKFKDSLKGKNSSPTGSELEAVARKFEGGFAPYYFLRGAAGDFLFDQYMVTKTAFDLLKEDSDELKELMQITEETVDDSVINERVFQYLLFVNLFGESGISPELARFYKVYGNIMSQLLAFGKVEKGKTKTEQKAMGAIEKALDHLATANVEATREGSSEGGTDLEIALKPKILPSPAQKAEMISNLLYGNKDKKIEFYPTKIIHAQVKGKSGKMFYLLVTKIFEDKKFSIDWEGLVNESRKKVECLVGGTSSSSCSAGSSFVTVVIPGSSDVIDTIKLQNKLEQAEADKVFSGEFGPVTKDLIEAFARYNAYLYARYLFEDIMDQRRKNAAGNELKKEEIEENNRIEQTLKDYIAALESMSIGDLKTVKEFKEFFREIREELQKQRVKK